MPKARSSTRDDFDRVKDSLHKLRAENRRLRKENGQLRKELSRAGEPDFDLEDEIEESGPTPAEASEPVVEQPTCPKCRSEDFTCITAGLFLIKVCKACGFRKRTKAKEKA